jgi:tetratricopeptide (TPR) repeat protein
MTAHGFLTAWQRMFNPRGASTRSAGEGRAAIHSYDPIDDFSAWARCRDRAQFHLGRARRAKDHGRYDDAAREIERALRFDDTSEGYFQVLGQCHLYGSRPNRAAARAAFERAFAINPRNGYTIKYLLDLYLPEGNLVGARRTVERAWAAGAPVAHWRAYLERSAADETRTPEGAVSLTA